MQSFRNAGTLLTIAGILTLATVGKAHASFLLNFEGKGIYDNTSVSNYYYDSYGISFTSEAVALVQKDAGGSGYFANEPSPVTALTLGKIIDNPPSTTSFIMNVQGGFKSHLLFYYSAPFLDSFTRGLTVDIYSGLNGSGTNLLHKKLDQTPLLGDINNPVGGVWYNQFVPVELMFSSDSTAKSVVFSGPYAAAVFDNISDVPTPGTGLLMGLGLVGLGVFRKRIAAAKSSMIL